MWSVMNVVCYEWVCYEQDCNERGLFWVVCCEWSVMNRSVSKGNRLRGPLQKSFPPGAKLWLCHWLWRAALFDSPWGSTPPCRGPVRNTLLSCVEQPLFVSPRLVSIRMRTRAGYITVISAYAPTLLAFDEDKDEFFQQLSDLLSSNPAGHDIALLGDFNARIGADTDSWTSVIGRLV